MEPGFVLIRSSRMVNANLHPCHFRGMLVLTELVNAKLLKEAMWHYSRNEHISVNLGCNLPQVDQGLALGPSKGRDPREGFISFRVDCYQGCWLSLHRRLTYTSSTVLLQCFLTVIPMCCILCTWLIASPWSAHFPETWDQPGRSKVEQSPSCPSPFVSTACGPQSRGCPTAPIQPVTNGQRARGRLLC